MSLRGKIQLHGLTDEGLHRDHNEDTIGCDENIALAILADGMGGHRSGEIASAITVNTIMDFASKKIKKLNSSKIDLQSGYNIESQILQQAITLANKNVYDSAQSNAQYRGMGTTVVAIMFYDNHFTVAHVGDSRLYRLRDDEFVQITSDHSYIQELLDCGIYTAEQAKNSEHKNLITRAVGIDEKVQVDIQKDLTVTDDIYLLCSDGVNDMIKDDLIKSIIINNRNDLEKAASEIIRAANEHGGKDNISALLAKTVKPFPAKNNLFSRLSNFLF